MSETTLMEHQRCRRQRQDGIITARDSGKSALALWEARSRHHHCWRQRWVKPLILFKKTPLKNIKHEHRQSNNSEGNKIVHFTSGENCNCDDSTHG
jgi:hypothetical protein